MWFSFRQSIARPVLSGRSYAFDYDIGDVRLGRVLVVFVLAVDEHDHVGVLLDGSESRKSESFGGRCRAGFHSTRQLRKSKHRHFELAAIAFKERRNFRDLLYQIIIMP